MSALVSLDRVSKIRGTTTVLDGVSLGVAEGDRVGVVGRNGAGKSTLARLLAGLLEPDGGRATRNTGLHAGMLGQGDELDPAATVRDAVTGPGTPEHLWRSDPGTREVLAGLGVEPLLDRRVGTLSGGERRRAALAALLVADLDLLVLDEPTNHLDVEAVDWLARHLAGNPRHRALLAVTHDRWFLDEVATVTWEVADGQVHAYDGGYSVYVLARAERQRQAASEEARRRNLVRKELAWLRRGAPARTAKPRFRIEAANALIADEPPPRDQAGLQRFAATRLGKSVYDVEGASLSLGGRNLLGEVTWRLGPGDRIGLIGVNGAGKTSLLKVLAGRQPLDGGTVRTGATVRAGLLSQEAGELPGDLRVLAAVEQVARVVQVGREELTASVLLERFGFPASRQWTPVADLSGGERRRLQLLRVLIGAPNVLLLDEPTNDLDTDTLVALEDLLDGWAGTLVVVSHDRWFLERVTDSTVALLGDGSLAALPGGVEQYLQLRREAGGPDTPAPARRAAGDTRVDRKELARVERALERLSRREQQLHRELAAAGADYARAAELDDELRAVLAEKTACEESWLELADRMAG